MRSLETLVKNTSTKGIDLYQASVLLKHDALAQLVELNRKHTIYVLDYFIQTTYCKFYDDRPFSPFTFIFSEIPDGYFRSPIGTTKNPNFDELMNRYLAERKSVEPQIYEQFRQINEERTRKHEEEVAALNSRFIEVKARDESDLCTRCNGEGGESRMPSRLRGYGDARWTADEEEWYRCDRCNGTGGYSNEFFQLKEQIAKLEKPKEIPYEWHFDRAMSKKGLFKPYEISNVHVKIVLTK